jgi:hypothetical protein
MSDIEHQEFKRSKFQSNNHRNNLFLYDQAENIQATIMEDINLPNNLGMASHSFDNSILGSISADSFQEQLKSDSNTSTPVLTELVLPEATTWAQFMESPVNFKPSAEFLSNLYFIEVRNK